MPNDLDAAVSATPVAPLSRVLSVRQRRARPSGTANGFDPTPPEAFRMLDPWKGPWRQARGRHAPPAAQNAGGLRLEPWVVVRDSRCPSQRPALRCLHATLLGLGAAVDDTSTGALTRLVRLACEAERWLVAAGHPEGA
ncbi:MAG: hypothetical protein R3E10_04805 [Gemmatimonadota bacterium]